MKRRHGIGCPGIMEFRLSLGEYGWISLSLIFFPFVYLAYKVYRQRET